MCRGQKKTCKVSSLLPSLRGLLRSNLGHQDCRASPSHWGLRHLTGSWSLLLCSTYLRSLSPPPPPQFCPKFKIPSECTWLLYTAGLMSSWHPSCCPLDTSSWISYRHLTCTTYKTQFLIFLSQTTDFSQLSRWCQHTSILIGQKHFCYLFVLPSNAKYDSDPQSVPPKCSSPHTCVPSWNQNLRIHGWSSLSCIVFA